MNFSREAKFERKVIKDFFCCRFVWFVASGVGLGKLSEVVNDHEEILIPSPAFFKVKIVYRNHFQWCCRRYMTHRGSAKHRRFFLDIAFTNLGYKKLNVSLHPRTRCKTRPTPKCPISQWRYLFTSSLYFSGSTIWVLVAVLRFNKPSGKTYSLFHSRSICLVFVVSLSMTLLSGFSPDAFKWSTRDTTGSCNCVCSNSCCVCWMSGCLSAASSWTSGLQVMAEIQFTLFCFYVSIGLSIALKTSGMHCSVHSLM